MVLENRVSILKKGRRGGKEIRRLEIKKKKGTLNCVSESFPRSVWSQDARFPSPLFFSCILVQNRMFYVCQINSSFRYFCDFILIIFLGCLLLTYTSPNFSYLHPNLVRTYIHIVIESNPSTRSRTLLIIYQHFVPSPPPIRSISPVTYVPYLCPRTPYHLQRRDVTRHIPVLEVVSDKQGNPLLCSIGTYPSVTPCHSLRVKLQLQDLNSVPMVYETQSQDRKGTW